MIHTLVVKPTSSRCLVAKPENSLNQCRQKMEPITVIAGVATIGYGFGHLVSKYLYDTEKKDNATAQQDTKNAIELRLSNTSYMEGKQKET